LGGLKSLDAQIYVCACHQGLTSSAAQIFATWQM